ncbi:MAG: fasciclin domain-containing protein [Prevotella sp.]|nr:fasciclin domain-containing protein [Prevotella sp.]
MKTNNYKWLFSQLAVVALMLPAAIGLTSCSEDIDESNLYTATGQTIEDYLASEPEFSDFNYILKRAGLDKVLSAYGKYTCFAPVNEAVQIYVDSLWNDTTRTDHNGMTVEGVEGLSDSLCVDIAKFHLVDFRKYWAVDMGPGTTITTMLGRELTTSVNPTTGNTMVNSYSEITSIDNELENGLIHVLNRMLTRSNSLVPNELSKYSFLTLFSEALSKTGLADSLIESTKRQANGDPMEYSVDNTYNFYTPTECAVGFTVFVEPDDFYKRAGINTFADLVRYANSVYANCADWYDYVRDNNITVSTGDDYTNQWNCLNMFVRYHIVKYKIPYDRLVYTGLNEASTKVGFYEYNETMLPYTLLKVSAEEVAGTRYVNRGYDNNTLMTQIMEQSEDTTETSSGSSSESIYAYVLEVPKHDVNGRGAAIEQRRDMQQPLNGYIHCVDNFVIYNERVPQVVLRERMRIDDAAFFPEMMNNNFRCATYAYINNKNGGKAGSEGALGGDYIRIPNGFFDNMKMYNGDDTHLYYLSGSGNGWSNYQKDEFNCMGAFDFALRLPPVPAGMYEIRMGYTANGNRGMMQVFLGTSNEQGNMVATDIPLDMRNVPSASNNQADANIATGWTNYENERDYGVQTDKNMHNLGWMRGPLYYTVGSTLARRNEQDLRRIVYKGQLNQGNYWLRFKTVLPENTTTQFHLDYIELVPEHVYNNPLYLEDLF